MADADQQLAKDAAKKAKTADAGEFPKRITALSLIAGAVSGLGALFPAATQFVDKMPLNTFHATEDGSWAGGFAYMPPAFLQSFTTAGCLLFLFFAVALSPKLAKSPDRFWKLAGISFVVTVLSAGACFPWYWSVEAELVSAATLEAQTVGPDAIRSVAARDAVAKQVRERAPRSLAWRDFVIGAFYFSFITAFSMAFMLLALYVYYTQETRRPRRRRRQVIDPT
jgi:hypothetical protein